MKELVKTGLQRLGYTAYRHEGLPIGVSWPLDVKRLTGGRQFKTVFDVGANVGKETVRFANQFPEAQIYSFEPEQKNFDSLQKTASENPRSHCFHMALGSENTTCDLHLQADSEWHSLVPENNRPRSSESTSQTIVVQKLDVFCLEHGVQHIDLLKTDTEGFDLEVLRGATEKLQARKISFVLSEVGFSKSDKRHTYFPDLLEFLVSYDLHFYDMYDHEFLRFIDAPSMGYCNALFVNADI